MTSLLAPAVGAAEIAEWEKIYDQDGIIVYQRNLEGSDVISLRGEATLPAALADVAEAMKDNRTANEWVPYVIARRTLKVISPDERIEYTHVGMPWPVTDRYFINLGHQERLPSGGLRLYVKSAEHPDPAWLDDDKVLATLYYSEFILTPLAEHSTRVTLEVHSDPRGLLPKWIVNMAQKRWPRDFFTGLTRQLEKRGKLHPSVAH